MAFHPEEKPEDLDGIGRRQGKGTLEWQAYLAMAGGKRFEC